jgi:hypothetical protein
VEAAEETGDVVHRTRDARERAPEPRRVAASYI